MFKIVVVADDLTTRTQIRTTCNRESDYYIAGEAVDGQNGLEIVKQTKPDILIMDIHMPDMDSVSFAERISSRFPDTMMLFCPVILILNI